MTVTLSDKAIALAALDKELDECAHEIATLEAEAERIMREYHRKIAHITCRQRCINGAIKKIVNSLNGEQ